MRTIVVALVVVVACHKPEPSKPKPIEEGKTGEAAPPAWPEERVAGEPKVTPKAQPPNPLVIKELKKPTAILDGADIPDVSGLTDEDDDQEDQNQDEDMAACPATIAKCPASGCAVPGNGKARSNEIKHGDPGHAKPNDKPVLVGFDVFEELQTAADNLVGQGSYPPPAKRDGLREIKVQGATLGEGWRVKITGYLKIARAEGPESVNCKIKGVANNDYHLSIVQAADDEEFAGIVAEMMPQGRLKSWNTKALHKLQDSGVQVLITGQLFYDGKHLVNKDANHPKKGQPKRFSLWEVHPVERFFVCEKNQCDPKTTSGWVEWN